MRWQCLLPQAEREVDIQNEVSNARKHESTRKCFTETLLISQGTFLSEAEDTATSTEIESSHKCFQFKFYAAYSRGVTIQG